MSWYYSCLSSARRSHNATRTRQREIFETVQVREWNVFLIRRRKGGIGDARGVCDGISLFQSWSPKASPPLPPIEIFHYWLMAIARLAFLFSLCVSYWIEYYYLSAFCGGCPLASCTGFSHVHFSMLRSLEIKVRFIHLSEPQDTLEYSSYKMNFSVTVSPSKVVGKNSFESISSVVYLISHPVR
jgi:hypothetical protein